MRRTFVLMLAGLGACASRPSRVEVTSTPGDSTPGAPALGTAVRPQPATRAEQRAGEVVRLAGRRQVRVSAITLPRPWLSRLDSARGDRLHFSTERDGVTVGRYSIGIGALTSLEVCEARRGVGFGIGAALGVAGGLAAYRRLSGSGGDAPIRVGAIGLGAGMVGALVSPRRWRTIPLPPR